MWLTVSVSVKGSSADRSSGFSMFLRKCSLRLLYALLESESVLAHVDVSRLLNRRNACSYCIVNHALVLKPPESLAFQHIDRSPITQGLFTPPSFIAFLRSDRLVLWARVAFHRVLVPHQLPISTIGAQLLTLFLG